MDRPKWTTLTTRPPCILLRGGRVRLGEKEFFIDNLLVRIHYIIVMVKWTGLAPWKFEFSFPGSLTSTFLSKGQTPEPVLHARLGISETFITGVPRP